MGKPGIEVFEAFKKRYFELTKSFGKEQYLVPYLMSSHPGSRLSDAVELAVYLKTWGYAPEQVQDFYPTPGTASTVMYYTGLDPLTMKPVYCAVDYEEKRMQRALLQWSRPENAPLVREALRKCHREDLIGYSPECLVKPERGDRSQRNDNPRSYQKNAQAKGSKNKPERQSDRRQSGDKRSDKRSQNKPVSSKPGKKPGSKPRDRRGK